MIEPLRDARQIADPVAIGVHEAARVDLVDRGAAPPRMGALDCGRGDRCGRHQRSTSSHAAQPKGGNSSFAVPGAVTLTGQLPDSETRPRAR